MPSWGEVLERYNQEQQNNNPSPLDTLLKEYIGGLARVVPEGLLAGQRGRGGLLRTDEGRGRLPREVGGTTPRRGARPDRRVHPLVQPRAHQTITRLDESGTIPSKPGNGCMIISKKMSAAPYPVTQISI